MSLLSAEYAGQGNMATLETLKPFLMQAGLYLTLTRGLGASEARVCYERKIDRQANFEEDPPA
jgi:hypothetical protein